ncbi:maker39 [Drosophila busckii]|uniref:Maker39 n=1 Tax=Drosophila busckii TaxID=30019 RepID=A0A0M4E8J3_DROBS|nr:uncharacterized protein LOC108597042 [Drosophila busckii]ALC41058.1 maker39 [Drosophila busckii]
MLSNKFFIYLFLVFLMLMFTAPAAEGTFILFLCLVRSPLCPFITTE